MSAAPPLVGSSPLSPRRRALRPAACGRGSQAHLVGSRLEPRGRERFSGRTFFSFEPRPLQTNLRTPQLRYGRRQKGTARWGRRRRRLRGEKIHVEPLWSTGGGGHTSSRPASKPQTHVLLAPRVCLVREWRVRASPGPQDRPSGPSCSRNSQRGWFSGGCAESRDGWLSAQLG